MTITVNNVTLIKREIDKRVNKGLEAIAKEGARLYLMAVTKKKETGPPFEGPHSKPGEYPYRETGRGARNIAWNVVPSKRQARFGVRGDLAAGGVGRRGSKRLRRGRPRKGDKRGGLHLIWLTRKGRKGPQHIVREHKDQLVKAFNEAIQ